MGASERAGAAWDLSVDVVVAGIGMAGCAAAITALLMLFPIMIALVAIAFMQAAAARRRAEQRSKETEEAVISLLSFLAGDKPWIAVAGAAIVGAAGYFLRSRKK